MNLSFAGCGFLGIYHVGVAVCFKKYAPHLLLNKISGASAGALAACGLLCDLPIGDLTSDVLRVATEARSTSLGPFHPSFNIQSILFNALEKVLPEDAHLRVNGKLHISLTRVYDGKNVIVSQFNSKEDLLQALLASAFIPLFSGILPPKFNGVRYMDGGFSDNLPTLDENTITVSPFCGESDICPRDDSMQLFHINVANTSIELSKHNIYRIARILFPPKPEILSNMCKQGFDDALRFLHRNNLINCTRCLSVQSTFIVQETIEESMEYDPQCHECKVHRQEAMVSNLPETVLTIFQEAIDTANKGIVNWVFKHRGMKLLSVLSLPYTLPADMVYATFTKTLIPTIVATPQFVINTLTDNNFVSVVGDSIEKRSFEYKVLANAFLTSDKKCKHLLKNERLLASAPHMSNKLWELSAFFLDQLSVILNKVNSKRQSSANISCQLAITEYGGDNYDVEACRAHQLETKSKMNLNFMLNMDDDDTPINQNAQRKFSTTNVLSRRSSFTSSKPHEIQNADDTFDNILQVTTHHEAIMAYYYLDDNNKVKVTEIFDVTDSESPAVQTPREKEINQQLQFDDDWDESTWSAHPDDQLYLENRSISLAEISEYSLDEVFDKDGTNIFSDPESEWTSSFKVEEPEDDEDMYRTSDLRPESDQPSACESMYKKPYEVPSFTFQDYDS